METEAVKFCWNCGTPALKDDTACRSCATSLEHPLNSMEGLFSAADAVRLRQIAPRRWKKVRQ